jgi:hypothetical protein
MKDQVAEQRQRPDRRHRRFQPAAGAIETLQAGEVHERGQVCPRAVGTDAVALRLSEVRAASARALSSPMPLYARLREVRAEISAGNARQPLWSRCR